MAQHARGMAVFVARCATGRRGIGRGAVASASGPSCRPAVVIGGCRESVFTVSSAFRGTGMSRMNRTLHPGTLGSQARPRPARSALCRWHSARGRAAPNRCTDREVLRPSQPHLRMLYRPSSEG